MKEHSMNTTIIHKYHVEDTYYNNGYLLNHIS